MKKMSPRITIDRLAQMIQNGFNEVYKVMETKMASKEDLEDLENRLEARFDRMEDHLIIIETALKKRKILA